jgi:hypothetical protein
MNCFAYVTGTANVLTVWTRRRSSQREREREKKEQHQQNEKGERKNRKQKFEGIVR